MAGEHCAYVCMGSNQGDSERNLAEARRRVDSLPGVRVDAASPVYLTEPQNWRDQPWFANQVLRVMCATNMTAPVFLDMLLKVETEMGRRRDFGSQEPAARFGPRVIDLDLLLFDEERHEDAHLILPHPRMLERAFVLVPLRDIDPCLILPGGLTPGEVLRSLAHAVEGNCIRQ